MEATGSHAGLTARLQQRPESPASGGAPAAPRVAPAGPRAPPAAASAPHTCTTSSRIQASGVNTCHTLVGVSLSPRTMCDPAPTHVPSRAQTWACAQNESSQRAVVAWTLLGTSLCSGPSPQYRIQTCCWCVQRPFCQATRCALLVDRLMAA